MKLTFTTVDGEMVLLDLADDMEIENVKALCEYDLKIPASSMAISANGQKLTDDKKTLTSSGLRDGDIVLVQSTASTSSPGRRDGAPAPSKIPKIDFSSIVVPGSASGSRPSSSREQSRGQGMPAAAALDGQVRAMVDKLRQSITTDSQYMEQMRRDAPELLDAVLKSDYAAVALYIKKQAEDRTKQKQEHDRKMQILMSNPDSLEAQQLIHDEIRRNAIQENFDYAVEHTPESMATVHMLYVNCSVNGRPMKAFVDSGAQMSIISREYAELCSIGHLIDERWTGMAVGVGTQRILGKIHACQMEIGGAFLTVSFTVLGDNGMQILLGLDMLKRHQMSIDLKRNALVVGTTNTEAPFLSESELPEKGIGRSTAFVPNEDDIQALIGMGFSRDQSSDALVRSEGNRDAAASDLLVKRSDGPTGSK